MFLNWIDRYHQDHPDRFHLICGVAGLVLAAMAVYIFSPNHRVW